MKFWTSFIILISLSMMAFCSFYLYKELTSRIEKTGGQVIGTITFKRKSASRRYTDNVVWEEIAQESDIYNYDAIRTLEYSAAVIKLKNGTSIELDQNTMLVVVLNEKGLNINFDKGGVSAKNESGGAGMIVLNSKDASILMDKGAITVNSSDKGMNIRMNSGTAKVSAGGEELKLTSDKIATLIDGKVESKNNSLMQEFPGHNSYLISYTENLPVNFSWQSDLTGEVTVELSHSSSFDKISGNYRSKKPAALIKLPPGDYYWRLAKGSARSNAAKFTILADHKPDLITPYMNQKLTLVEGTELVPLRWNKSEYASSYEILISRDINMSDIALTLSSKVNTIYAQGLAPGKYYCTVKSLYTQEFITQSSASGPYTFTIEKQPFDLIKPVPLEQGPVTVGGPFSLSWKGVQGAENYKVELSSDSDFNNIVTVKNAAVSFVEITSVLPEGMYYWRVSAISGKRTSGTSETALQEIIKPVGILLISPPPGSALYEKPEIINFSWRDPNNGNRYHIEISETSDFRSVIQSSECNQSSIKMKSPGEGGYFWRVILNDASGNIIAKSETGSFIIPGELKEPVIITPKENEKIFPGFKKRLRFEWSKIPGADEYEVEIFQRIAGIEKTLLISTVKSGYVELGNQTMLMPGRFSWVVRARQLKNGKLTAFKESQKSFFVVETAELLPAPKVNIPQVLFK